MIMIRLLHMHDDDNGGWLCMKSLWYIYIYDITDIFLISCMCYHCYVSYNIHFYIFCILSSISSFPLLFRFWNMIYLNAWLVERIVEISVWCLHIDHNHQIRVMTLFPTKCLQYESCPYTLYYNPHYLCIVHFVFISSLFVCCDKVICILVWICSYDNLL